MSCSSPGVVRLPCVPSIVSILMTASLEWHVLSPTLSCTRRIGNVLTCTDMYTWAHGGLASEMILRTVPVSDCFPCFSVSERILWVLFEVLCGYPGFHCHIPTSFVPVLPITFSDDTYTMRLGMLKNLEIFWGVLCA